MGVWSSLFGGKQLSPATDFLSVANEIVKLGLANDYRGIARVFRSCSHDRSTACKVAVLLQNLVSYNFPGAGKAYAEIVTACPAWTLDIDASFSVAKQGLKHHLISLLQAYQPALAVIVGYMGAGDLWMNTNHAKDFRERLESKFAIFISDLTPSQSLSPIEFLTFIDASSSASLPRAVVVGPFGAPPWFPFRTDKTRYDLASLCDRFDKVLVIHVGPTPHDILLANKLWGGNKASFHFVVEVYNSFLTSKEKTAMMQAEDPNTQKRALMDSAWMWFEYKCLGDRGTKYTGDISSLILHSAATVDMANGAFDEAARALLQMPDRWDTSVAEAAVCLAHLGKLDDAKSVLNQIAGKNGRLYAQALTLIEAAKGKAFAQGKQ